MTTPDTDTDSNSPAPGPGALLGSPPPSDADSATASSVDAGQVVVDVGTDRNEVATSAAEDELGNDNDLDTPLGKSGSVAPATSPPPSSDSSSSDSSSSSSSSCDIGGQSDKILRYFHVPSNYMTESQLPGDEPPHYACATCTENGTKTTSKEHARLAQFDSNYISTTKYNAWNFLPRNLWEQFQKKANFYFLIIACLSFTPLSPKSPAPAVAPLIFVLAVTAIKEAIEDYKRYKVDVQINSTLVSVYRNDGSGKCAWQDVAWADVQCGDMVRILSEQFFPADLVLLQSSSNQGVCSIETANLDGETNLKVKQAVPATYEIGCSSDGTGRDYPDKFAAVLESDPPSERMDANSWNGNLRHMRREDGSIQREVALGFTQLLLRGCRLRNTAWIIGLVAFTGRDTKLMKQNKKSKDMKRSNMDRAVDGCLYLIFVFQAALCIIGAIGHSQWLKNDGDTYYYLKWPTDLSIPTSSFLTYFTFLVLLDILVPISLYVTMELVKLGQAMFINADREMRHVTTTVDGERVEIDARARTSNLNEELGQVSYIFSDKTGTLTRNEMRFLRCTVGNMEYGPGCMEASGRILPRPPMESGLPPMSEDYQFEDNRLIAELDNPDSCPVVPGLSGAQCADEFLTLLATCHTVMLSCDGCEESHIHNTADCEAKTRFNAQSPDELALVDAALTQHYFFHHIEPAKFEWNGRSIQGSRLHLNIRGVQHYFDVFEVIEFTSSRKRCSVLLYDHRDKKVKIYCKGADNVIRERLSVASLSSSWLSTHAHLQRFASIGLRTLCCAYRVVPDEECAAWLDCMARAKSCMSNREEAIAQASEKIETNFILLGTTAIEDRLQDGVPDSIARLAGAGIRIWVLTGDKVETAINIGRSCRLLTDAMRGENLLIIDIEESLSDTEALNQTLEALSACEKYMNNPNIQLEHVALVVSGKALGFIFPRRKLNGRNKEIIPPQHILDEEAALQRRFLHLAVQCKAVVCCRMSPKQKSQVVRLVKENMNGAITLAIGDGANDVAMIEAAHVGIGIEGLEGKQAVMASDYSLGQFRFLTRLLLIHGSWSYRRLATVILYSFYKNIAISLVQLWFAIYSGFSGQIFYDQVSGSLYNVIFTSLPILLAGLFNRDIPERVMLAHPRLYTAGHCNECFNYQLFIAAMLKGVVDSLLLFFLTIFSMHIVSSSDGLDVDQWLMGTALFTFCVLVVNVKVTCDTTTINVFSATSIILTILAWWAWMALLTSSPAISTDLYGILTRLAIMPSFWFLCLMLPVACALPDIAIRYVLNTYYPNTAAYGTLYEPYLAALSERECASAETEKAEHEQRAEKMNQMTRQHLAATLNNKMATQGIEAFRQSIDMKRPDDIDEEDGDGEGAGAGDEDDGRDVHGQPSSSAAAYPPSPSFHAHHRHTICVGDRHQLATMSMGMGAGMEVEMAAVGPHPSVPVGMSGSSSSGLNDDITVAKSSPAQVPLPLRARTHANLRCGVAHSFTSGQTRRADSSQLSRGQTWRDLARLLRSENVGFTPFTSSVGEHDFIMTGGRLRDLSMANRKQSKFNIGPQHQ